MSEPRRPDPPSGMPPPVWAPLPGGGRADLRGLAERVAHRYFEAHPEHVERYGPAGWEWCVHDTQHLINWAVLDAGGYVTLDEHVSWLAGVLAAREFPLDALRDHLTIIAGVLREEGEQGLAAPADLLDAATAAVPGAP